MAERLTPDQLDNIARQLRLAREDDERRARSGLVPAPEMASLLRLSATPVRHFHCDVTRHNLCEYRGLAEQFLEGLAISLLNLDAARSLPVITIVVRLQAQPSEPFLMLDAHGWGTKTDGTVISRLVRETEVTVFLHVLGKHLRSGRHWIGSDFFISKGLKRTSGTYPGKMQLDCVPALQVDCREGRRPWPCSLLRFDVSEELFARANAAARFATCGDVSLFGPH